MSLKHSREPVAAEEQIDTEHSPPPETGAVDWSWAGMTGQPQQFDSVSCALTGQLVQRFNVQRERRSSDPAGLDPSALRRVLDFMHTPTSTPPTLSQLAEVAGISRFHFARMFRRSTGDSPMSYLERIRLSRAQEMIQSRRYSLAQVAAAVGYADQSHFTRRFRLSIGCTPAVYARQFAAAKEPEVPAPEDVESPR